MDGRCLPRTLSAEALADVCREHHLSRIGFEKDDVTFQQFEKLQADFGGLKLHPVLGLVESLRLIKDIDEIAMIQEAGVVAGAAYCYVLGYMRPGQTEREIASCIDYFLRSRGDGPPAFETIVAAGERGAMPHGCATTCRDQKRPTGCAGLRGTLPGIHVGHHPHCMCWQV